MKYSPIQKVSVILEECESQINKWNVVDVIWHDHITAQLHE